MPSMNAVRAFVFFFPSQSMNSMHSSYLYVKLDADVTNRLQTTELEMPFLHTTGLKRG